MHDKKNKEEDEMNVNENVFELTTEEFEHYVYDPYTY